MNALSPGGWRQFYGRLAPRWTGPAIILVAAAVATAPQLLRGTTCGHDFDFHLVSWFDALGSWRQGILYPHWAPSANFGAGEPRFVFYPPLTWMAGAALGAVLPWVAVPVVLTFLLLAATGMATRALARPMLADGPATLAGCAALFSGYALFTTYERSAFGELAGGFWIPLLLLLILRDHNPNARAWRRAFDGSTAPLALVVAGTWLSNAPLGVMACYLLAAMALVMALLWRSWAPVLRATAAAALGMGLAGLYLVPAAVEQGWVDIRQAIDDPGLRIDASWLFGRHGDPALELHDAELFKVSVIAISMIAVALAGVLISGRRGTLPAQRRWWISLALIPVAVLFLLLPISLPVWNALPKLRFLQLPWRWLVVVEAPMGIFFAAAVWTTRPRRRTVTVGLCAAIFLAATAAAGLNFFQPCDDEDAVRPMLEEYGSGGGFEGVDEYAPVSADDSLLATGLPDACLSASPTTALGRSLDGTTPAWDPSQVSCEATFQRLLLPGKAAAEHLRIIAVSPRAGDLILRLRSYPAWEIRVNGQPVNNLPQRNDGLIAVPVPKGPVDVSVDWSTTDDAKAGRWMSAIALTLIAGLYLMERKLRLPEGSRAQPRL